MENDVVIKHKMVYNLNSLIFWLNRYGNRKNGMIPSKRTCLLIGQVLFEGICLIFNLLIATLIIEKIVPKTVN